MMNYFSNRKKWMAYLILLTFVFTCIVPTNLAGGNSEAWAADSLVGGANEDSIEFKMFNYDKDTINYKSGTTEWRDIAPYFNFRSSAVHGESGNSFYGNIPNGENAANATYDVDGFTKNHATVKRVLVDGYPVLAFNRDATGKAKTEPSLPDGTDLSLAYLFSHGDHAVKAYTATGELLTKNDTHFEYDSAKTAVNFNITAEPTDVSAGAGSLERQNYVERTITTAGYPGYADFLPFNYATLVDGQPATIGEGKSYHYDNSTDGKITDYWFGMTMEFDFKQPADGNMTNGEQMIFSFSGDDDVWVFIDDVLVLDLGGTHGTVDGSINFATGKIKQYLTWNNANATDDAKNNGSDTSFPTTLKACYTAAGKDPNGGWNTENEQIFADNSVHTLKFFYLERGAAVANCMIDFNLQPIETVEKTVIKNWADEGNCDGIRPKNVQVQLFENDRPTTGSAITLSEENDWAYTWKLAKYDDEGRLIEYDVKELKQTSDSNQPVYLENGEAFNDDYIVTYDTGTSDVIGITNHHTPETIDISGTKHWIDEGNKNNTRPESIKVNLTGMVDSKVVSTTSQEITVADDWQFAFNDLPKYHEGEVGKEINYVITEDYVEGYQTFYDSDSYDITNIYNDSPVLFMDLPVTKIWQDDDNKAGIRPGSIELQLKQNGVATGSAITLEPDADGNWQYTFEKLPRYDKDGKSYVYSVVEKAVEGYLSTVVARADSVTIYNKPYNGEVGTFTVSKTVDDPDSIAADDTRFGFELEVSAEMKDWDSLIVYNRNKLLDKVDEAESAKATAQGNFEKAKELFAGKAHVYSTGSAYLFVMDVTTPQAYEYAMIDENGRLYSKTTESAYDFWGTATEYDDSEKVGLLAKFFEAIQKLAKNFSALPNPGTVLNALFDGKGTDNDIAVEFGQDDAQALLNSANALLKAENDVDAAKAALKDFDDNVPTTPSAIKLTMTPKNGNGIVKELKPEVAAGETNFFDATNKVYRIPFELAHGEEYKFSIEATTGASIKYQVTEIDTKGANETRVNNLVNTRTGIQTLTKEVEHALWAFTNIFKQQGGGGGGETGATIDRAVKKVWNDNNNPDRPSAITVNLLRNGEIHDTVTLNASNGWSYDWTGLENGPLWSVREVNVADGYTASVSRSGNTFIITNTLTTTSTIPDETIPDENVPTGSVEPGVPLDEPEIPLGDAPATGDTNNAAPFMALMLFAVAGLVITRRKLN